MHCSVIEHGMTSLSYRTAVHKNEAKLNFLCSLKTKLRHTCSVTEQSTTSYVLTVLEHSYIQRDVIACTVL